MEYTGCVNKFYNIYKKFATVFKIEPINLCKENGLSFT